MAKFSRRAVLLQMGAGGLAAMTPGASLAQNPYAELDARPWSFLRPEEARFLAAMADVFIPEDDFPSASQAGVVDFIDLQLAGPYGNGATLYLKPPFRQGIPGQGWQAAYTPAGLIRTGIGRIESGDARLADLAEDERTQFVTRLSEDDGFDLGDVPRQTFFDEILALVNEGYFADPIYGGNKDYAGWRMVGFPGAHTYYTDFVDKNVPFPAKQRGIGHIPGTTRSATVNRTAAPMPQRASVEEEG